MERHFEPLSAEMETIPEWHFEPLGAGRELAVNSDFRFGADAVLLARFAAPCAAGETVCDLGTGCGILPFLLLEQPVPPAAVCGVDIQPEAIALCQISRCRNRVPALRFLTADWNTPAAIAPAGSFDRVLCNPPYFSGGRPSASPARRIARQEAPGTLPAVCAAARHLLRSGGHLCLCHRPERLTDLLTALRAARLEPKRLQTVQQRADTAPWLLLIDAVKDGRPGLQLPAPYILENTDLPGNGSGRSYRFNRNKKTE